MKTTNLLPAVFLSIAIGDVCAQTNPIAITATANNVLQVYNGSSGLLNLTRNTHSFSWSDAGGNTRTALMVDQSAAGSGFLRSLTYKVNGVDRVCAGTGSNGAETYGDGFVQNHSANGGDDESTFRSGTTTMVLSGDHHAIIQFTLPNYTITDPANGSGVVPTTIQWFFATGRDHPIFSITQDARATNGNLGGDSRSPYGDMHYDGTAFTNGSWNGDLIGGVSMGDTRKFVSVENNTTNESSLLTTNSGFKYNESNSIPYAMEWTKNINAEQGHVMTQPISIKDAGRTDLSAQPITPGTNRLSGPFIGDEQWPYQIAAYGILGSSGGRTKRLTWGTNFGAIGGFNDWWMGASSYKDFTKHYDGQRTTGQKGMLLAYSVFDVFGLHNNGAYDPNGYKTGATGKIVTQMENMQQATLSASVGSVVTQGLAGVGLSNSAANMVTYQPAGYNHIYATWEVNAQSNNSTFSLTPGAGGSIENPIFVIHNFSATNYTVKINGTAATSATDYFASFDNTNNALWLTINRTVNANLTVELSNTIILPLKLLQFSGRPLSDNSVLLNWLTTDETNIDYFEIERSEDGSVFKKAGTVTAANTAGQNEYQFTDLARANNLFYRLKIIDENKSYTYSKVIKIPVENTVSNINLYPNPATDFIVIKGANAGATISLFNSIGHFIKQIKLAENSQAINIHSLPAGLYFLKYVAGNELQVMKLIKN